MTETVGANEAGAATESPDEQAPPTDAVEEPDGLLYHYTSAAGLVGILGGGDSGEVSRQLTFHASDLLLMNDISELSFGLKLVKAHAAQVADAKGKSADGEGGNEDSDPVQQLVDTCNRYLGKPTVKSLRAAARPCVCAASFTTRDDLLSQWVTYGAGGGYAIGIGAKTLREATYTGRSFGGQDDRTFKCLLSPVRYGNQARDWIAGMPFFDEVGAGVLTAVTGLHSMYRLAKAAWNALRDPQRRRLQTASPEQAVAAVMIGIAAQCKHKAFKAEKEWRLLAGGGDPADLADLIAGHYPPEFRAVGSRVLPYRPIVVSGQDGQSPIKRLVVGPAPDQAQLVHAAQQLLIANGHDPSVVRTSKVPYRGW